VSPEDSQDLYENIQNYLNQQKESLHKLREKNKQKSERRSVDQLQVLIESIKPGSDISIEKIDDFETEFELLLKQCIEMKKETKIGPAVSPVLL
jgi:hypothetical protein